MTIESKVLLATQKWLETMVIELNLCPFAKKPWQRQEIRFEVSEADHCDEASLIFITELQYLQENPQTETTLLILPQFDADFYHFLDLIDRADEAIDDMGLRGDFQLAHFHPDYQFAGESKDACSHFTNRSPHAILHVIREASITRVIDSYPEPETIPVRNVEMMERLGREHLKTLLASFKQQ